MKFLFEHFERKPAAYVEVWYDRHARYWVIQQKDEDGMQVGSSDGQGQKPKMSQLKKQYPGLPIKFT